MKITKIVLITKKYLTVHHGTDIVMVYTNLPYSVYPYSGEHCMQFEVTAGNGEQYIRENFENIRLEVVSNTGNIFLSNLINTKTVN